MTTKKRKFSKKNFTESIDKPKERSMEGFETPRVA